MNIIEKIASEEGFSGKMYKCPADKWTIGYGFNLESQEMPRQVADLWLSILIDNIQAKLDKFPFFEEAEAHVRLVLLDMAYQIGVQGLIRFSRMIDAIERKNYQMAAFELMNSRYAIQTPARAQRNADIMRGGQS